MGGSAGGGSTSIDPRVFTQELPDIHKGYKFQQQSLEDYIKNNPVVQAANTGVLDFWKQLPGLLGPLQDLYSNLPSIQPTINNLQNQFGGLPGQLLGMSSQLGNQFGGLANQLQSQFGRLPQQLTRLAKPLMGTANNYLSGILQTQGRLSPEASRDVAQQTRELASQYGTGRQLGTLGTELLNRQGAREARYNTALGQYSQATGQVGLLDQLAQSLGTNLATTRQGLATNLAQTRAGLMQGAQGLGTGLAGFLQNMRGVDIGQRSGLAGAIQNLQSGGLNQLLGVQQGNVSGFSQLTNPMLSYLSNLFGGNLQARIAQAQINQQGNIASDNKTAGLIGGALNSLGSIAGGIAMSDERVKTKIKKTGLQTTAGPVKTWEYKTRPGVRFIGHMAQDVEKRMPDRVLTDPVSGVKMVVGLPVIQISPPERKAA